MVGRRLVLAAVAFVAGALACSPDEGAPGPAQTGGAGGIGGMGGIGGAASWTDAPCGACATAACAAEKKTCGEDPACAAWDACLAACAADETGLPAPACSAACTGSSTPGATAYLACLAKASSSCTGCSGAGGAPTNPIYTQMCAPANLSNACLDCQADKCCDSAAAIKGKASGVYGCWLACKDPACESACYEKFPDQVADFGGWQACTFGLCSQPCTSSACAHCQADLCKEELAACYTLPECFLALSCGLECAKGDAACAAACSEAHPSGKKALDDYAVCTSQQCLTKCAK